MRAIASVTLSFGLVSIPVKLYSATEASSAIRFKLMSPSGARLRQQYVSDAPPTRPAMPLAEPDEQTTAAPLRQADGRAARRATAAATAAASADATPPPPSVLTLASTPVSAPVAAPVAAFARPSPVDEPEPFADTDALVERHQMVRGYEFEKGSFVLFKPAELKALQAAGRDSIDIVAFIPDAAVDPVYYDKAYLVAPDKRGEKTYALLLEALRASGRTALARWAWKGREYVVQIRPSHGGLVLQQLFFADEVRLPDMLNLDLPAVGDAELQLALKLIEQGAQESYDATQFVDEERQRILAAVERKIAGGSVIGHDTADAPKPSGQVIDLLAALRASLRTPTAVGARKPVARAAGNQAGTAKPAPVKPAAAAKKLRSK